jgi:aconitate hydratase
MDARSIAATAINGGYLTPATDLEYKASSKSYTFNQEIYKNRVYYGFKKPSHQDELRFGPNIADWPQMIAIPKNLLLKVASVITDPVTTTDELIPSGETSSYRSNPLRLAEFTLSRKDPGYVGRAKAIDLMEQERRKLIDREVKDSEISTALNEICTQIMRNNDKFADHRDVLETTGIGSVVYAVKPGDGSAREQAASCQKVLGGWANIAVSYATKRYRSNLINWGLLPFTMDHTADQPFKVGDLIFIPDIREKLANGEEIIEAQIIGDKGVQSLELFLKKLTDDEREIILKGCLINYYAN